MTIANRFVDRHGRALLRRMADVLELPEVKGRHTLRLLEVKDLGTGTGWGLVPTPMF